MNNLILLRKQNNKTQADIAKILNVATNTYCWYEKEKSEPNIETLIKLADYYNVSLDYLVGRNFKKELGYLDEFDYNFIKSYLKLTQAQKMFIAGSVYTQSLNI